MNTIQRFEKALGKLEAQLNEANKKGVPLEEVMNTKPNGYIPKIQYWTNQQTLGRTERNWTNQQTLGRTERNQIQCI